MPNPKKSKNLKKTDLSPETKRTRSKKIKPIDYEAIFRNSLDAIIVISSETGEILEVNDAAEKLLQYSGTEFRNLKAADLVSTSEFSTLEKIYQQDSKSFNQVYLNSEFYSKTGKKIPVSASIRRLENSAQFLIMARDISGIKQTEEALKRESFIFENLNDGIILTDLKGYIQSWNQTANKIFGYTREEIIDKYVCRLIKFSGFDDFFEENIDRVDGNSSWTGETKILRKDLREGVSETSVFPFKDSSGEHIAYVIIVKDITQRKLDEQEMKERDRMYAALIESSADAIYVLHEKRLLLVNSAWCKMFGYSREEATSENFDIMKIIASESNEMISEKFSEEIEDKPESASYEMKGLTKDNRVIDIDVRVSKIYWRGKLVYQGIYRDITERKNAESELKESEEKFRRLAEKSLVGIYIIQDGIFKYVNPKLAEIFGYTVDELQNKMGPVDLTFPVDRKVVYDNMLARLKGEVDSIEYSFRGYKKDNSFNYVEVYGSRTMFNGKPAIVGTLLDVTEREKVQAALKESEKKYKTIIEAASDSLIVVDVETGKIIDVNKQAVLLTGYTREELIGSSNLMIHPAELRQEYEPAFLKIIEEKKSIAPGEVLVQHKDGTVIPVEISNSHYELGGRRVVQGIFRDLRERKKIEEEIRKLSRAVEQSPAAVIITDTSGKIEYVNPHFCKVTGYSYEETIGQNPNILKSGKTSDEEYGNLWKTIAAGNDWRGEFHNKKKNGEFYWEQASISPIRDEKGKITHYIAIKEDITDKKILQEELVKAKERAEESDQMKSEFLSQMSHEIRTPLNVILSYNSFLKDELGGSLDDDVKLSFTSIDSAGKRLLRTIDMILNLAAIQKGKININFDPINLDELLINLTKEFQFHARQKNLYLNLELAEKKTLIKGDDYIVGEIFQNLLNNAIKYTNTGGILVSLSHLTSGEVKVDIKDTGIGISEEYLPKLFLPFTQEEAGYTRKFEGNGLGLALVKSYLDLLNAKIKVESKKGKGTTFSIFFESLKN